MHERWVQNYAVHRDNVLSSIAWPVRNLIVAPMIYHNITATLHGQGTGRYSVEEIGEMRRQAWRTIEGALESVRSEQKKRGNGEPFWILGKDEPTEADATLFGFVVSSLIAERSVVPFSILLRLVFASFIFPDFLHALLS